MGLDISDLKEYGFDFNNHSCSGNNCPDKKTFKKFDKTFGKQFGDKMVKQGSDLYKKARCHPTFEKYVTPKVEVFFNLMPCWTCT